MRIGRPEGLPPELDIQMRTVAGAGLTPFAVWRDEVPLGLVTVSDVVKPEAEGAVRRLEDLGLQVAMVTGDRRSTAEAIAARGRHRSRRGGGASGKGRSMRYAGSRRTAGA